MIEVSKHGTTFTGTGVAFFRMAMMKVAMEFELKTGRRAPGARSSVFNLVKREFGLKGSKAKVAADFAHILDEARALQTIMHGRA